MKDTFSGPNSETTQMYSVISYTSNIRIKITRFLVSFIRDLLKSFIPLAMNRHCGYVQVSNESAHVKPEEQIGFQKIGPQ